ncbi:MAG TPA: PfkB family carbohydrate kinase [Thermomicrobiales bacterium]|nr:PfkB family carbohydrate kinase [Thermomicrobiales bacterium]
MRLPCVGEVGVDHYTNLGLLKPGGIAFNVAVNALACGLDVSIVSALGTDPAGVSMVSLITDLGLTTENLRRIDGTTARQNIRVEPDGERRFVGYDKGVLTRWRLTAADVAFIAAHDAIFVPLSDGMEHIFRAVARTPGPALKAADFSLDYELADYDNDDNLLRRHCGSFDVIFFGGRPRHFPMMESLVAQHPEKLFVLTLGAEGAIAFHRGGRHSQPAPTVEAIDTTGCGDAFQAAFLAAYLQTLHVPTALAAVVITHLGSTTFELAN